MPKTGKKQRHYKSGKGGVMGGITSVPFKAVSAVSITASGNTIGTLELVLSTLSSRIAAFNEFFKRWRLKNLRVKYQVGSKPVPVEVSGVGIDYPSLGIAVGYQGTFASNINVAYNALDDVVELVHSSFAAGGEAAVLKVPSSALNEEREEEWLYTSAENVATVGMSTTTQFTSAGTIITCANLSLAPASGAALIMYLLVTGVCEFCEPIEPSVGRRRAPITTVNYASDDEKKAVPAPDNETKLIRAPIAHPVNGGLSSQDHAQLLVLLSKLIKAEKLPPMSDWADASSQASVVVVDE